MKVVNAEDIAREQFFAKENMPTEIRNCTLEISETMCFCVFPVALHGRIDQVFRDRNGYLIIVDTKVRKRPEIYFSDIIQVSAYKTILKRCRYNNEYHFHKVRPYAYIRLVQDDTDTISYTKVDLLSDREIISLWTQYQSIHFGLKQAQCSCKGIFHSNNKTQINQKTPSACAKGEI